MKNIVKIIGLLSILAGCAEAADVMAETVTDATDVADVVAPVSAPETTTAALQDLSAMTACEARFYVSESDGDTDEELAALHAELEWATARWSKATECDIAVGAEGEGIPVRLVDSIVKDGESYEGWWGPDASGRQQITVLADRPFQTLAHEIGHALSQRPGHVDHGRHEGDLQVDLMETTGGNGVITTVDLEWVCNKLNCQVMNAEEVVFQGK